MASTTVRVLPLGYAPIGKQALTVSSSAVGFTVPTSEQVRSALVTVEYVTTSTDTVRYWVTGDTPTTSDGHLLYNGDILELSNVTAITNFRVIATGNDMKLQIEYFGGGY